MAVAYTTHDGIAVLTLDNPPVNGLGHPTRVQLLEGIDHAVSNPAITAIIIIGDGKVFCGGADIGEFNTPMLTRQPNLQSVIDILQRSTKPVIAAIHGLALGGGLELALGAHYRVALRDAKVGLPEVKLGLLPGAGGTQLLPRAVGLEIAVNMIVSGKPVAIENLPGLIDLVVSDDLLGAALKFARSPVVQAGPCSLVRDRAIGHPNAEGFIQFVRNGVTAVTEHYPAPLRCIDAIGAGVRKGFAHGLKIESECFADLLRTPQSQALRHGFFAQRAAGKIADIPADTAVRTISRVAVIGAGTMGGGIAMNFINASIPVLLLETRQAALDLGMSTIRRNYQGAVDKGRMSVEELEARLALITPTLAYEDLVDADLIIEAVFEELGVKEQVFSRLDQVAKSGAILASNTSTLNLDRIAAFTSRPQDVIGLHFFSPANVMKLLEVVRGAKTSREVLATVMGLARRINKVAVVSGVCDGFIGNRMIEQYMRQAFFMLEEGALPAQVDRVIEGFGFAMGPFRMSDLAGNDIGWAIRKRHYQEKPGLKYPKVADRVCEAGRLGQKVGSGWYDYLPGDRKPRPSKAVDELVVAYSTELGVQRRKLSDQEITERLVFALVNEGARILEEGIAAKASDIDVVYLTGYGFPAWRGGPMLYADSLGLYNVERAVRGYAKQPNGDVWQPAKLLVELAAQGRGFNG
jgi:3-hydroxyacyl-CoA dehydrogenase